MQLIADQTVVLEYDRFHDVLRTWFLCRGDKKLPSASDFLVHEDGISEYRMHAVIKHDPLSIDYKQVGKTLESLYGKPITGKNLDELYNDWFRKRAYAGYSKTIENLCPVYERRKIATIIKTIGYHKVHLPFGGDTVEEVITYIIPMDGTFKKKSDWEKIVKKTPWL